MKKNIEVELRAEIQKKDIPKLIKKVTELGSLVSHTSRLSVLFHGRINEVESDIRVRTKNKQEAEIVIKRGDFHSHDRTEESIKIKPTEFLQYVSLFSTMGFSSKVIERENLNYDLGKGVLLSIVKAKNIAYVEIEKMSDVKNKLEDTKLLKSILSLLNLNEIKNKSEFDELCVRLSKHSDWEFDSNLKNIKKLEKYLSKYHR